MPACVQSGSVPTMFLWVVAVVAVVAVVSDVDEHCIEEF